MCEHTHDEIKGIDPRDLHRIGMGASKRVYLMKCGKHVLKVAADDDPDFEDQQFRSEVEVWNKLSEEERSMVAPIVLYCLQTPYIVQEKCDKLEYDYGEPASVYYEIRKIDKHFQEKYGLNDVCQYNMGILNGRIVAFDLGV